MSNGLAALVALALAGVTAYGLTPAAIDLARRTNFLDRPVGYKGHGQPTPYLGGAVVMIGVLLATTLLAHFDTRLLAILACAVGLAVLGAVDDRYAVAPGWRIAAELIVTWVLFTHGVRWTLFGVAPLDFALTALWIVGIVNAVNLMDNMDGTAATVAATSAAGIGVLALINGSAPIAIASLAVTGGCLGFLPRNLAGPAQIFLGDGGSMPLGLLIAALAIAGGHRHGGAVLVGAMLVGLPILDTVMVSISRLRRGLTILTAGRDHLTHRLLGPTGSARRVCLILLVAQGLLAGVAVASDQVGTGAVIATAVACTAAGVMVATRLDSSASRHAFEDLAL